MAHACIVDRFCNDGVGLVQKRGRADALRKGNGREHVSAPAALDREIAGDLRRARTRPVYAGSRFRMGEAIVDGVKASSRSNYNREHHDER